MITIGSPDKPAHEKISAYYWRQNEEMIAEISRREVTNTMQRGDNRRYFVAMCDSDRNVTACSSLDISFVGNVYMTIIRVARRFVEEAYSAFSHAMARRIAPRWRLREKACRFMSLYLDKWRHGAVYLLVLVRAIDNHRGVCRHIN